MGNKQQLQLNNETLDSILSNVLGLPSQESLKQGAYVWKKLTAQVGDFIDFVVSNSPTAYPNGGYKSGYWYEKFQLDPVLLGCTKYAVDKFTLASRQETHEVNITHSLGEVPQKYILLSSTDKVSNSDVIEAMGHSLGEAATGLSKAGTAIKKVSSGKELVSLNGTFNAEYINLYTSMVYLAKGVEYTLITMT